MLLKFFLNVLLAGVAVSAGLFFQFSTVEIMTTLLITATVINAFDIVLACMLYIDQDNMLMRYYNRRPEPEISFYQYRRAFIRGGLLFLLANIATIIIYYKPF